jgi:hypothetical protein
MRYIVGSAEEIILHAREDVDCGGAGATSTTSTNVVLLLLMEQVCLGCVCFIRFDFFPIANCFP